MANLDQMAKALQEGMETKDAAPTPSITPDTKNTVVVGNPNEVGPKKVLPYQMVFNYAADEVSDKDKEKMVYLEDTGEYALGIEFNNVRVKPLIRTKVAALFLDICVAIGVVSESGITSDDIEKAAVITLIDQTEKLAQLAQLVLGLDDIQLTHLNPGCLFDFFVTLTKNEPNLKHEGNNFLSYSDFQKRMSTPAKK